MRVSKAAVSEYVQAAFLFVLIYLGKVVESERPKTINDAGREFMAELLRHHRQDRPDEIEDIDEVAA